MNKKDQLQEILEYIPSGAQTLSTRPIRDWRDPAPDCKGEGAYIWDTDGKKYLDMMLALGR